MASAPEFSESFEFALPFTSASTYKYDEEVTSPTVLIGQCPMFLGVYPLGDALGGQGHISAFVEVRPRADWWVEHWVFPNVRCAITVSNTVDGKDATHAWTRTFHHKAFSWGLCGLVECDGYGSLKHGGWIFPDDTVRFRVTLTGDCLTRPWNKLKETSQNAIMYKTMKYTDMHILAGMQEGAERQIVLKHVCPGAVRALLEHIYVRNCSEATLGDGQILQDLLALADQYELPELVEQCARSMVKLLDTSNAYAFLQFLRTYGDKPSVREHFREAKRMLQKDESLLDAALFRQPSPRSSVEDADGSQPSKRPRTEPA